MEAILFTLFLSLALAMDAFAVSISLGMSGLGKSWINKIKIGLTFGGFQALLFLLGYYVLSILGQHFQTINSYISSGLLFILGLKMLKDVLFNQKETCSHAECIDHACKRNICLKTGEYRFLTTKVLLFYGTATSIDAFAAGVSYGLVHNEILLASLSIGIITLGLSIIGASFGLLLKRTIGSKATILGGVILILLGIKALFS